MHLCRRVYRTSKNIKLPRLVLKKAVTHVLYHCKNETLGKVSSQFSSFLHPSGAVLCVGTACSTQTGDMGTHRMSPYGTGWASLPGKGGVRRRTNIASIELSKFDYLAFKEHWKKKNPRQCGQFPGKGRRMFAGEALGRGTGVQGQLCASCQPALSPVHRPLQQAPRVLHGDENKPPASCSAIAENVNSACSFAHLSLCG